MNNQPQNILERLADENGLTEAINQVNMENSQGREPVNYEEQVLGNPENHQPDEFDSFIDEDPAPAPKKRDKKYNDSKQRIQKLSEEKRAAEDTVARERAESDLIRRELKRVKDENSFMEAQAEKLLIDQKAYELEQKWQEAYDTGDSETLREASTALSLMANMQEQKQQEIDGIYSNYKHEQDKLQHETNLKDEIYEKQEMLLIDASDQRELDSPLYDGFLGHHDYLDPRSPNYNYRIADRLAPLKIELIEELTINGQADTIGTTKYFEELASRIYSRINSPQKRGQNMTNQNDPRYQQPNYKQIHDQYQPQQYAPQPQYQPPAQQYQQPVQQYQQPYPQQRQQQYQPQQYAPQPQQSVAPVNRAGYNNQYSSDPRNFDLNDDQHNMIHNLLGPSINELSKKVRGRTYSPSELEEEYKYNYMNPQVPGNR